MADIAAASSLSTGLGRSFVGEGAALLAAFLWAAATLMFGKLGKQLTPLVLNIVKGGFAIALMLITLLIQASLFPESSYLTDLPTRSTVYLVISGALGIGLGDTAYFSAINTLGARRALLLETLAPPIAAVLAWIFLAERLSPTAAMGIMLTLIGIAWVISERVPGSSIQSTNAGLKVALLATFAQAAGAVLSRAALAETSVSPLWSGLIRLSAGLAFMLLLSVIHPRYLVDAEPTVRKPLPVGRAFLGPGAPVSPRWSQGIKSLKSPQLLGGVFIASLFGTYLGIWLQQTALKYTATGIAQALLATSPLFVLPMSALLGDRISWRSVCGVGIALCGVWLLLFNT